VPDITNVDTKCGASVWAVVSATGLSVLWHTFSTCIFCVIFICNLCFVKMNESDCLACSVCRKSKLTRDVAYVTGSSTRVDFYPQDQGVSGLYIPT